MSGLNNGTKKVFFISEKYASSSAPWYWVDGMHWVPRQEIARAQQFATADAAELAAGDLREASDPNRSTIAIEPFIVAAAA